MKKSPLSAPPAVLLLTLTLLLGCARGSEPERPASLRVESPALGISVAALPEPFEVTSNDDTGLTFEAPGAAGPGIVRIELDQEETGGINLVAEAENSKAWFEEQPDGRFFGNLELVTPLGTAFTARGSYRESTGSVEEIRVFALHPTHNRLLRLTYRYPPGEGRERMQQLAELLGEIEALPTGSETQEASSAGSES